MKNNIFYLRTDLGTRDLIAGGSVAHTLGVIQGFVQKNYTVTIASSAMIGLLQKLAPSACKELYLPRWTAWCGFKLQCVLSNIIFFAQSIKACNASTTAYIYQRYSLLNCTGVMLSWWKKIPLILEFNGSEVWVEQHWSHQARLKLTWLVRWFELLNVRYADTVVVVSQPLKKQLVALGVAAHKILVNPNGVDAQAYDPAVLGDARYTMRKTLQLEDAFIFGFIGTFSHWHGINILEAMIPQVLRRCPRAAFLLIGSGPLQQQLQQALSKQGVDAARVICAGTVEQEHARTYLAACDAFVSPTQPNPDGSEFFGSPTKLFEYMSLAKPIIASDLSTIADILRVDEHAHEQLAILVPPHDVQKFVEAACALVDFYTQEERTRMGNSARDVVLRKYTWQQHVGKIMSFVGN